MDNNGEALIKTFDMEGIAVDEYEIVKLIQDKCPDRIYPDEILYEFIAFDLEEDLTEEKLIWNLFFSPNWMLPDGKGGMVDSSPSELITNEMIKYWKKRVEESVNPMMKARYADLVWTFEGIVTQESKNYKFAELAIDSYICTANQKAHCYEVKIIDKLRRALALALKLRDKNKITKVAETMIRFEDSVSEDSLRGLWGFSFDHLLENKNVTLVDKQVEKIIGDLELRLERVSSLPIEKSEPWAAEAAAVRLAKHYRRSDMHEEKCRVLRKTYSIFQSTINPKDSTRTLAWLQHIHDLFIEFGLNDDAGKVRIEISKVGSNALKEMKKHEITQSISGKDMEAFLDEMTDGSFDDTMFRLIGRYIPRREMVEDQLEMYSKKYFSLHLSSTVLQDFKGRPIAAIGTIDLDWEGHLIRTISQNMSISSFFLAQLIDRVFDKYLVSSEILWDWITQSPVVEDYQYGIIKKGVEAYFSKDYVSSMHILIPQLEGIIRNLTEQMGRSILRPNKYGGFHYYTLGELIMNGCIKQIFSEDVELYLTILLTDSRGWNLRNTVCHGLNPTEYFDRTQCDRIIHAMLLLSAVRSTEGGV